MEPKASLSPAIRTIELKKKKRERGGEVKIPGWMDTTQRTRLPKGGGNGNNHRTV